jgi:hypothetical protein
VDSQINISPMFILGCPSQNTQRPFFHLLGLCGGLIKAQPEVRAPVLPSDVDGGFHIGRQDDELRRPVVVMAAKCDNVCLGHSGRKIAKNRGESKRGRVDALGPLQPCRVSVIGMK